MKRFLFAAILLALFGAVSNSFAAGIIIIQEQDGWRPPIWPPGPVPPRPIPPRPMPPPRPHPFAPLEVNYSYVNTRITDQIAVTTVDEDFYNPNGARLEGTFVFPVPKGAQLDKFSMEIDGKKVDAELLAADKARGIYEDIVRKMRDPALLEYSEQDVFKVRIFPIEPNSHKRVSLSYTQVLKSDNGLVAYSIPLGTEKFSAKPVRNVSVKVDLETKRPIKTIYSPTYHVEVRRNGPTRATAGYEASDVQPDADFALYFAPEKDEIGVNLMTYRTSSDDGYFLLLTGPGVEMTDKEVIPKDVAFVLDTSGSMAGQKIEQARKALQFCVANLNEGDRFEIMRFSTEVEPLFNKLVDASKENRKRAEDFIKDLKAIGGTAIDDALTKTLALRTERSDRPFVVIFLTDGRPTIGTTEESQIVANVKKQANQTRVFCFGIGSDVNTHLLDKITDATRAASQYVLPEEDIEVKVSNFFAKIRDPVLANPMLSFTGDIRTSKMYPSPLPDLFRGDQLVLVGRYAGKGDSAAVLEGRVNGSSKRLSYDLKFPGESSDHDFIPRLWATRRVGFLLDEIRLHGESKELKDEVTDLARKYGIVTPYTAFLIYEDENRRGVAQTQQSMPQLGEDLKARELAQSSYGMFKSLDSGDAAVRGAQLSDSLRSQSGVGRGGFGGAGGGGYAGGGGGGASSSERARAALSSAATPASQSAGMARNSSESVVVDRMMRYTEQQQFVNGRTFFQNGTQWVDSEIQKLPNPQKIRIQFGSIEYFDLIRKQPQTRQWLALGQNVQFLHDGSVYEIYE